MKTFIGGLLSRLKGTGTRADASGNAATPLDPATILYSMPTIAADTLDCEAPGEAGVAGAPQFHEDAWRQIEFLPGTAVPVLQRMLAEFKAFERAHRSASGWTKIYLRDLPPVVVIPGNDAVARLAHQLDATIGPAPILFTSSQPLGQLRDGFSITLDAGVVLYGRRSDAGIEALGTVLAAGTDDTALVRVFTILHAMAGLVLVDWRAQQLLASGDMSTGIEVWRP